MKAKKSDLYVKKLLVKSCDATDVSCTSYFDTSILARFYRTCCFQLSFYVVQAMVLQ